MALLTPARLCLVAAAARGQGAGGSTGIWQVVIKDVEVMPGWTDEDTPSVAHDRAVIPGDVDSATFYLMMADEDLAVSSLPHFGSPHCRLLLCECTCRRCCNLHLS